MWTSYEKDVTFNFEFLFKVYFCLPLIFCDEKKNVPTIISCSMLLPHMFTLVEPKSSTPNFSKSLDFKHLKVMVSRYH